MQLAAQVVFWGSMLAMLHTYLFYPFLMRVLARNKRPNAAMFAPDDPDRIGVVPVRADSAALACGRLLVSYPAPFAGSGSVCNMGTDKTGTDECCRK